MKKGLSLIFAVIISASVLFSFSSAYMSGDVNADGGVNNKDVVLLFRVASGGVDIPDERCDINHDGQVNNKDVTALFRLLNDGMLPQPRSTDIYVDPACDDGLLSYITRQTYCTTALEEDPAVGRVLAVTSKSVPAPNTYKPYLYFNYKAYCDAIGEEKASLAERPYVVFRVKAENVFDRRFSVIGLEATNTVTTGKAEPFAQVHGGGEWHYICVDFSSVANAGGINVFRISFEQLVHDGGEKMLISEIHFCTKEEAEKYVKPYVYPMNGSAENGVSVRLMQFNIQTENGNPAPVLVKSEMYRRLVDELMPDTVGMQEVTVTWRKWLDEYVFNDSYASVGEPRTAGGEANPIYYRKDKFDLVEYGTFWLSDTPDVAGSAVEGANYPRICTWAVLKDKATGVKLLHMNTHLDHNGNNDSTTGNTIRKEQIAVIIKFSQKYKDLPMFLTGDLNNRRTTGSGETYALIKRITGVSSIKDDEGKKIYLKLSDARLDAKETVDAEHIASMMANFDESSASYNPAREPIDYVFYNAANTEALTYETFIIKRDGYAISDHLPLFTTFLIKAE